MQKDNLHCLGFLQLCHLIQKDTNRERGAVFWEYVQIKNQVECLVSWLQASIHSLFVCFCSKATLLISLCIFLRAST